MYSNALVQGKPGNLPIAERLGVYVETDTDAEELTLLHRSVPADYIDISGQDSLKAVRLPCLEDWSANILITDNAALSSLYAPTLGLHETNSSLALDLSGNALNQSDLDRLLNRLAFSLPADVDFNGTGIDISGGTNAAPSAASSLAVSLLEAASITVTTN
jgi:hypothetical protein